MSKKTIINKNITYSFDGETSPFDAFISIDGYDVLEDNYEWLRYDLNRVVLQLAIDEAEVALQTSPKDVTPHTKNFNALKYSVASGLVAIGLAILRGNFRWFTTYCPSFKSMTLESMPQSQALRYVRNGFITELQVPGTTYNISSTTHGVVLDSFNLIHKGQLHDFALTFDGYGNIIAKDVQTSRHYRNIGDYTIIYDIGNMFSYNVYRNGILVDEQEYDNVNDDVIDVILGELCLQADEAGACYENLMPFIKALDDNDLPTALALVRANLGWVNDHCSSFKRTTTQYLPQSQWLYFNEYGDFTVCVDYDDKRIVYRNDNSNPSDYIIELNGYLIAKVVVGNSTIHYDDYGNVINIIDNTAEPLLRQKLDTIISLIEAANEAKRFRQYAVANGIFAILIANYTSYLTLTLEVEDTDQSVETLLRYDYRNDMSKGYYDLLTVSLGSNSLCIPTPLLPQAVCDALITSTSYSWSVPRYEINIVSRHDIQHNRQYASSNVIARVAMSTPITSGIDIAYARMDTDALTYKPLSPGMALEVIENHHIVIDIDKLRQVNQYSKGYVFVTDDYTLVYNTETNHITSYDHRVIAVVPLT